MLLPPFPCPRTLARSAQALIHTSTLLRGELPTQPSIPQGSFSRSFGGIRDAADREWSETPDADESDLQRATVCAGLFHDQPMLLASNLPDSHLATKVRNIKVPLHFHDGTSKQIPLSFKDSYSDEYTAENCHIGIFVKSLLTKYTTSLTMCSLLFPLPRLFLIPRVRW